MTSERAVPSLTGGVTVRPKSLVFPTDYENSRTLPVQLSGDASVGGEEMQKEYKAGDVFWIDAVEHDHKAITQGGAVIVTVK